MMSIRKLLLRSCVAGLLSAAFCQGASANNVQVRLEGSLVTIFGDSAANSIVVSQNAAGDLVVAGRTGTTVNGRPSVRFPRLRLNAAEIRMGSGNDFVTLRGVTTGNNLFIDLGAGNDRLNTIEPVTIGANLTVEGSAGNDVVQLTDVTAVEDIYINGGQDVLRASVTGVDAGKSLTIIGEGANDVVEVVNTGVNQLLSIEVKGGSDSIDVSAAVADAVSIDSQAGADSIVVENLMTTSDLGIFTGIGDDEVVLTNVDSGKSITVSVDVGIDEVIGTSVSAAEDAVFEGGDGRDTIFDFGITGGQKKEIKEFEVLR